MKRIIVTGLTFLLLFSAFAYANVVKTTPVERKDLPHFLGYVQNRFIVVLTEETRTIGAVDYNTAAKTGVTSLDLLANQYDVNSLMPQFPGALERGITELSGNYKVQFDGPYDLESVMEAYAADPLVEKVEPIGIHMMYATPNDGYFSYQWYHNQASDHDIDSPEAWNIQTGSSSVIVALLDSGTRYYHPDLGGANASVTNPGASRGNMWINNAELNGSAGVDDDSNGYTDDWIGYDFIDGVSNCWPGEDCTTKDNDPRDFNGHGTHTAGIITMLANDGYGMAGTAGGWGSGSQSEYGNGVKVMVLRNGYSYAMGNQEYGVVMMDASAEAFYYAADNGATIASCSWGSSNSGGLGAAVDYFIGNGGIVCVAAGNGGAEEAADYLNGRGDCVSVGATNETDDGASFTTYGTWVDICAPGDNIYSTFHDHEDPNTNYWASMGGTSMATPMVAGVVGLIWSQNTGWTSAQVKSQLYSSADNIDAYLSSQYIGKMGVGRINSYNAVNTGPPPAPVANFSGSPTSGTEPLTVSFSDLSTGTIDTWSWTFGDGGNSSAQNPSHQYTSAGTYTVSLTVTGPGGSDDETKTNYITVNPCAPPTAGFIGSPTSGPYPLTVDFTDQSTGAASYSWNFGDSGTSTAANPSHIYTAAGTYTVTLSVTNACGSDQLVRTDYITVTDPPPATQAFAQSDISVLGTYSGSFANTFASDNSYEVITEAISTSHPRKTTSNAEHKWDFNLGSGGTNMTFYLEAYRTANGDGDNFTFAYSTDNAAFTTMFTVASATEQVYTYDLPAGLTGTVWVRVVDTNRAWGLTSLDPVYIDQMYFQFGTGPVPPVADFSGSPTSGAAPLTVSFTDLSTGAPDTWSWTFGDGGTSSAQNPTYEYTATGTYTVSLTVSNAYGSDIETKVDYITVVEIGNDMYVYDMVVGRRKSGPNYLGTCTVTIYDDNSNPVSGATVYVTATGPTGGSFSDATGSDGTVSFETSGMKRPSGEWCFEVTNVTHGTFTYNAGLNNVNQSCESGDVYGNGGPVALISVPEEFSVTNFPNPFNPEASIQYSLPVSTPVSLEIYNIVGQRIATLVNETQSAGYHAVTWNASNVPSGVYFYRIVAGQHTVTNKLVLMK